MQDAHDIPSDIEACQARIIDLMAQVDALTVGASVTQAGAVIAQQQGKIDKLERQNILLKLELDKLSELERQIAELKLEQSKISALERQIAELLLEQAKLQKLLANLLKGNRSERRILSGSEQAYLPFENQAELEAAQAEAQAEAAALLERDKQRPKPRPRKSRSGALPAHLPRVERIVDVPESMAVCPIHGERKIIDYDITETLKMQPAKLWVEQVKYPKLVCPGCAECGIVSPERPTSLVEGNRYDTSVAASVVQAKWDHHMPIYRQQDIFAGSGWTPARSTLLNLVTSVAFVVGPLVEFMKQRVQQDIGVGIDDTSCRMLLPQEAPPLIEDDAKSKRLLEKFKESRAAGNSSLIAKMWVYSGLHLAPYNIFDFRVSRHRDGPDEFFATSNCLVQGDCFSGNTSVIINSDGRLTFVACWGHARRKLVDVSTYKEESETLIGLMQKLYDIETRAMDYSHEERQQLRQREATVILACIRQYIDSPVVSGALPKSDFTEAIRYIRNHWEALTAYVNDGRIPIDNNRIEQLMKQVAMGRKAWLFVGNVEAGEQSAMMMSLVSSAKRHDLDVWTYLKDVLDQLLAGETDYEKLLPDQWKLSHPEAVRVYRVQERRDKADRKQLDAARRRLLATK